MHEIVYPPEKIDRFEIFSAAKLVRHPLAFLARVIEVEHRSHGIDAQAVEVIALEPRERISDQETADFIAAVVKNQRAPIHVGTLAGIRVFVEMRAVKFREGKTVAGKMGGHPVENHPKPAAVQVVDKPREILGRPKAVGGRVKARDLITPRAIERMFRQRHHLNMREAHVDGVVGELHRQLPIRQGAVSILGFTFPRAEVNFVNRHRPVELTGLRATLVHPRAIAPLKFRGVADDRGVVRWRLKASAIRIRLNQKTAALVADFKFVELALAEARHKQLPHPRRAERAHRMKATIPAIETADDRNPRRRRCPHGKRNSGHATKGAQVRTEFVVDPMFITLIEQEQILIPERRQKAVGIEELPDFAVRVSSP